MATTKRKRTTRTRALTPEQQRAKQLRNLLGATLLVTDAKVNLEEACISFAEVANQLDDALITRAALIGARFALDVEFFEQFVIACYDRQREQEDRSEQPCA